LKEQLLSTCLLLQAFRAFKLALGLLPDRLRFEPSQMPFICPSRRGGHKLTMGLSGLMVILRLEGLFALN
jgi:hypothetical protein